MLRQTPEADNTSVFLFVWFFFYNICTVLYCYLQLRKWCEYFLHHWLHDPSVRAQEKQVRKWVVPQDISQSASCPSVGYAALVTVPVLGDCWSCPLCPVTQCVSECVQCKWAVSAVGPQQRSELLQKVRHEAAGRADLVAVQAPLAADSDLLECVLQLRSLHRLPRTHHPGPEVPDPVHPAADHLGLLLPAVLPVGGQQHGRTLQEDVSIVRLLVC